MQSLKIIIEPPQPDQSQSHPRLSFYSKPSMNMFRDEDKHSSLLLPSFVSPQNRSTTKKRNTNFCIRLNPRVDKKHIIASPQNKTVTDRHKLDNSGEETSLSASPMMRKSLFRLKKPGDIRVTTQSLRSMNFSSAARIDDLDDKEEDDMMLHKLEGPIEEDVVPGAGVPQETTGDHAIENFYTHYKKLDKISDINDFKHSKQTMFSNILKKSEDLKLFPSKIGLVKFKGPSDSLKIK